MADPARSAAAPSRRQLLTPPNPPAPPPSLRNLFGLLPGDGLPEADPAGPLAQWDRDEAARQAELEGMRQRLATRVGAAIPDVVKRGARGAAKAVKDTVAGAFTPTPEVEAVRAKLKGMVTPPLTASEGASPAERFGVGAANLSRQVPEFLIDQAADATTPGDAALNLLPAAKAAKGVSSLAAIVPTSAIKLPKAAGSWAKAIQRGAGAMHPQKADTRERLARLYEMADQFPRAGDWRGLNAPEYRAAFDQDMDAARQFLRIFAANTPSTNVPNSAREAASTRLWRLRNPKGTLTKEQALNLPAQSIGIATSKVPNINRALADEKMNGLKVQAFGNFMQDILGPLGDSMKRTRHPRTIEWNGYNVPLIDLPHDRHEIYAVGGLPDEVLDDEYAGLRDRMSRWEGLWPKGAEKPLQGNQGGLTNKDIYDRISWGTADTLGRFAPDEPLQKSFGKMWHGAQVNKQLEGGEKATFDGGLLDMMDYVGLLRPGAMNDPERIREALRRYPNWGNLGWGPGY